MSIEQSLQVFSSLKELKEIYKRRLDDILNKQLTVENIGTFADEALEGLVALTGDILKEYKTNEALKPNLNLNVREQEDDAFKKLELLNIQDSLQRVIEVKDKISGLKNYLDQYTDGAEEIIIPPKINNDRVIIPGSGKGIEDKKLVPRLLTLLYILETDFDIEKEQIKMSEGKVTPDMMRKTPYARVEIPNLERIVYICDEEGNASYIFDADKLEEIGVPFEEIDISDKEVIKNLLEKYPGVGARIVQSKNWRENIVELLSKPIPKKMKEEGSAGTNNTGIAGSEFVKKEKREFLPFEEFQREVMDSYQGERNIKEWYLKILPDHKNWPYCPNTTYKNKGWIGWPELVDVENRRKKEYPSFSVFQEEVRVIYQGESDVSRWYNEILPDHKNWPSEPHRIYKGKGWVGWSELVGKENRWKKEYLSFNVFQEEVKKAYQGEGDVHAWYHKVLPGHKNWPYEPHRIYKGKGWVGWSELVEKEKFSPFDVFQEEVKTLYQGERNIYAWYHKILSNHKNWPYCPSLTYKNKGWIGWPELVGVENRWKKEYPSFDVFREEVRALYQGESDVSRWYYKEFRKHKNWPSEPHRTYKDKGWVGWPELVGKKNNHIKV